MTTGLLEMNDHAAPQSPAQAPSNDVFPTGATVQCVTCHDEVVEGEVLTFDRQSRVLALRTGTSPTNDTSEIVILNLHGVKSVKEVRAPAPDFVPNLPSAQPSASKNRFEKTKKAKLRCIAPTGVSLEGLRLFGTLKKTLDESFVDWKETSIVVKKEVIISPPYTEANCARLLDPAKGTHTLTLTRKIIDKHVDDQKQKVRRGSSVGCGGGGGTDSASNPTSEQQLIDSQSPPSSTSRDQSPSQSAGANINNNNDSSTDQSVPPPNNRANESNTQPPTAAANTQAAQGD